MLTRLRRLLGIRREIQRRLDVNLEFDDLAGDAADVRNGARLALVSLRSWLDGAGEEEAEEAESGFPWVDDARVGQECLFWLKGTTGGTPCVSQARGDIEARLDWIGDDGEHHWLCQLRFADREILVDDRHHGTFADPVNEAEQGAIPDPPVPSDGIPHITDAPLRSDCWFMLRGDNKRYFCWLWATGRDEGDRAFFVRGLPGEGIWTMVRNRDIEPPPADGIYREPKDIPPYGQNGDTPKSTPADIASLSGNFGYSQL